MATNPLHAKIVATRSKNQEDNNETPYKVTYKKVQRFERELKEGDKGYKRNECPKCKGRTWTKMTNEVPSKPTTYEGCTLICFNCPDMPMMKNPNYIWREEMVKVFDKNLLGELYY
jgi:hypothetical protein